MLQCPKRILQTNRIKGGHQEFADKPLFTHLQEEMSRNSSQANVRVIQALREIESHLTKKSSPGLKRKSGSEKTSVKAQLSSELLPRRRSQRLNPSKRNVTMSPASFTTALEMASKTKKDIATIRSMRTGTSMGEAMFSPAPRLKRTVSFVTGLSELGDAQKKLKMEDVTVEKTLDSQFAACTIAPKSTTEAVCWTPISKKGILTRNIGSVLGTTATPVSPSTCSTVSSVPPAPTLRVNNALTTDFLFE